MNSSGLDRPSSEGQTDAYPHDGSPYSDQRKLSSSPSTAQTKNLVGHDVLFPSRPLSKLSDAEQVVIFLNQVEEDAIAILNQNANLITRKMLVPTVEDAPLPSSSLQQQQMSTSPPPPLPPRNFKCAGHRGFASHYPENSILAFQKALSSHVDAIELDIDLSQDNVLVIMHDDTLERTTNGTGQTRSSPWSYLQTLLVHRDPSKDYADCLGLTSLPVVESVDNGIPTLEQILDLVTVNAHNASPVEVIIDVKDTRDIHIMDALQSLLSKPKFASILPRITIGIWEPKGWLPKLESLYRALPTLTRMYIGRESYVPYFWSQVDNFSLEKQDYTTPSGKEFIRKAKDAKSVKLTAWTVNHANEMINLANDGLDYIISDCPALCMQVRSEKMHI